MKLYITRHGETLRNAEQKVLGRTDDPFSAKGKAQAAKRDYFKRYPNGESYFDMAYRIYDVMVKCIYPINHDRFA